MDALRELTPRMIAHFTEVDHDFHLALIAVTESDGRETEVGVARYVAEPARAACEFAIVVTDSWQRKGLGTRLMRALIAAARAAGIGSMHGDVLASNRKMLQFVTRLGFTPRSYPAQAGVVRVELPLGR